MEREPAQVDYIQGKHAYPLPGSDFPLVATHPLKVYRCCQRPRTIQARAQPYVHAPFRPESSDPTEHH